MNDENHTLPEGSVLIGIRESGGVSLYMVTGLTPAGPTVYTLKGFCHGESPFKKGEDAATFLLAAVEEGRAVGDIEAHLATLPAVDQDLIAQLRGLKPIMKAAEGHALIRVTSQIYKSDGRYGFILKVDDREIQRSPACFATDEEARRVATKVMDHAAQSSRDLGKVHRPLDNKADQ